MSNQPHFTVQSEHYGSLFSTLETPARLSLSIRIWLVANYQPPTDRTLAGTVLMVILWWQGASLMDVASLPQTSHLYMPEWGIYPRIKGLVKYVMIRLSEVS